MDCQPLGKTWKGSIEGGARLGIAGNPNFPPVSLRGAFGDRKANSCSGRDAGGY